MMSYKFLMGIFFAMCALNSSAEMVAQPMPHETRLVHFTYDENRTYEILTRTGSHTDIQLEPDEKVITDIPAGDKVNWDISGRLNHIFVKPFFPRLVNTVTIITNKRTYQLILKSSSDDGVWYQRVKWQTSTDSLISPDQLYGKASSSRQKDKPPQTVPDNMIDEVNASVKGPVDLIKGMDFNYEIDGEASFKPVQVFNDKTRTWIMFPDDIQTYPALFVKEGGDLAVVGFRKLPDANYFLVTRIFDEAVLKFGDEEVVIRRKGKQKKWWFE